MLTQEQLLAVNQVVEDFNHGAVATSLYGPPGVGKTLTTGEIVRRFCTVGYDVAVTASTNKAVDVLRDAARTGGWKRYVSWFGTIHSFLGLKVVPDSTRLARHRCSLGYRYRVVVIDEASMLDYGLVHLARHEIEFSVFVGDKNQLPPVNERRSLAFMVKGGELTTNMRQKDPQLQELIGYMTEAIEQQHDKIPKRLIDPFREKTLEEWEDGIGTSSTEVALAWTNAEVDRINRVLRRRYGFDDEYCVGDRLIFTSPLYVESYGRFHLVFPTSSIVKVRSVSRVTHNGYPCFNLRVKGRNTEVWVTVYDTSQNNMVEYLLSEGYKPPKLAKVKYAYALTVHRSQGSEWSTVHANMRDMRRNQDMNERRRLAYVAFSRAKRKLRILT